ncbi:MAG: hypothetical protein RIQ81_1340 [Pseudomonadota bacterium]|jgi:TolA-binding protein
MTSSVGLFRKLAVLSSSLVLSALLCGAVGVVPDQNRGKDHKESSIDVVERKIDRGTAAERKNMSSFTRAEAFLVATEQKLSSEIGKTIQYLLKIEPRTPPQSPERLRILEQLLNLNMELALYESNDEFRRYDEAYERWDNGGRRGPEPKLVSSKSQNQWRVVANRAENLLRQFPRARNADETMFNQAVAYQFLKRDKDAARAYTTLIRKYPNSPKAGDAYFQLGDYNFDKVNFRAAIINYKSALRYERSRGYSWALFKLGWCYYNLGDYSKSLDFWKQTVSNARKASERSVAQLKDEALRDMVYSFAELKAIDPAINYYRANGGEKFIGQFLLLLSTVFTDQGQYAEAIGTLKRFQAIAPTNPQAPDAQKDIASLLYELGRWNSLWAELEAFPRLYGPGSAWETANQGDRKLVLETQALIKDQIIYYAKVSHKSAQKNDDVRIYREAMKGYNLFLKTFPKSSETVEVKYNMADIEFFLKDYRSAGKLYLDIALLGKDKAIINYAGGKKPTNIHSTAARYMLDSYYLDFEPELKKLIKEKPDFNKPGKVSERAGNFVKGCGYYKQWYPEDRKNLKTCDLYVAEIYYRLGDRNMSIQYLTTIAYKYPNDKEGPQAVESLIPLYKNDRKSLLETADKLLKIAAYQKGALGEKLRDLRRDVEIEEAEKIPDPLKRAMALEEQARKKPNDSRADLLVYKSAFGYVKGGDVPRAVAMFLTLIKRYPKSAYVKEALLEVAKLKDRRLELESAAELYSEFAERYPKEKEALPAMGRACELFSANESQKALPACLTLAKVDPSGAKVFFERMIRSAAYGKKFERLNSLTATYFTKFSLNANERIIAAWRVFNAADGKGSEAAKAATDILQSFQKSGGKISGEAQRCVGEIVFRRALAEVPKYEAVKLAGGTVDALAASIDRKAGALGRLKQAMETVAATKDSYWGVASIYETGRAFEAFASDLENPPGIKGASIEDVKKQLAPQAQKARQEAATLYKIALDTIGKFNVYSDYSKRVVTAAAKLGGAKLVMEDWIQTPDLVGSDVSETVAAEVR